MFNYLSYLLSSELLSYSDHLSAQVTSCSTQRTTVSSGAVFPSAPANVRTVWRTWSAAPGTNSPWRPRMQWDQGASVRSLKLRPMGKVANWFYILSFKSQNIHSNFFWESCSHTYIAIFSNISRGRMKVGKWILSFFQPLKCDDMSQFCFYWS